MSRSRLQLRLLSLALILAILFAGLPHGVQTAQAATELFFTEYIEGSSNNKALEIYNGTGSPVDLAAGSYNVQIFFNGSASAGLTISLVGTVANGDVFVLAQSSADPAILAQADQTNGSAWFNGNDAVVLRRGTTVIDSIGQVGFNPGTEWGSGLTSTADNTLRRKTTVQGGDANPTDVFDPSIEWDGFAVNTFDGLGSGPGGIMVSCGPALSVLEGYAASTNVSATDTDGTVVDIAITNVNPDPAPGSITLSGLVPASSVGGTASATISVDAAVPSGSYSVTVTGTNNDASPQTGTCTLSVSVLEIKTIGEVQGSVPDSADGATFASPLVGQTVVVQGVIYQKTQQLASNGRTQYSFFIQNTAATADADPNTSDGIFVFMSTFPTLIGGYFPQVGDEIVLQGRVSEFFNLTELSSARTLQVVQSGLDIDAEVPIFETDPPSSLADANRYWERREGMRAQVPSGSVVLNGRNVFPSTADGEVWVAHPNSAIAQRSDPYTRRAFRDPHPLDDIPDQLFDNGNGYRILMGSLGIKATSGDSTALIAPARTFDTLNNSPVGGVYFSFEKYSVQVAQQLDLVPGVDPSLNSPPQSPDNSVEYSVVTFNLENLYDYRDDPFDGCDFTGNSGCPGVSPPFDYVPSSNEVYQARLLDIAHQIVDDLHSPDVILAQEAEDQDICAVSGAALSCGTTNNADGRPDSLQELATVIAGLGGPQYLAAYDRDGADDRGIVSGFLYRADRVELLPAAAGNPVLGSSPQVDYRGTPLAYNTQVQNPKSLNAVLPADVDRSTGVDGNNVFTRPPQVGLFRIWRTGIGASVWVDVYAVSNHFSSTPNARVGQRTEQAAYNAAIVAALLEADPEARITVGGDLNVYPRPDDPFVPGHPLFPSDQLGLLYEAGMTNLWDILVAEAPASAYSYIFQGQTQTLDQMFVTPVLLDDLVQMRAAHINSDWPNDYEGDVARGTSDHDPQAARYSLVVNIDRLEALVRYYNDLGAITGNNTFRKLMDRLEKARRYYDSGLMNAYRDQLAAFSSQVRDLTPQFITQTASDALVQEADFLRLMP